MCFRLLHQLLYLYETSVTFKALKFRKKQRSHSFFRKTKVVTLQDAIKEFLERTFMEHDIFILIKIHILISNNNVIYEPFVFGNLRHSIIIAYCQYKSMPSKDLFTSFKMYICLFTLVPLA